MKYNDSMLRRVIFDVILFISIFIFPWWVTLIWAVVGLFVFVNFYEFLISSVIVYTISVVPQGTLLNKSFFVYLSIIIFYMVAQYLRHYIILYKNEIPYKTQ